MLSIVLLLTLSVPYPTIGDSSEQVHCESATGLVYGKPVEFKIRELPFENEQGRSLWLHPAAADALFDLVAKANAHGYEIKLNSAYRTQEHQMQLWRRMPGLAAHPKKNVSRSHQTGVSVDIDGTIHFFSWEDIEEWEKRNGQKMSVSHCEEVKGGYECPTILYWWLERFAGEFGFENNVHGEKWHWTYTGSLNEYICRPNYQVVQALSH